MLKKFVKNLLVVLTVISLIGYNVLSMQADEGQTGSITIDMIVQEDKNGNRINKAIPGIEFEVYKVWSYEYTTNGDEKIINILFDDPFKNLVEIDHTMSEDQIQKTVTKFVDKLDEATLLLKTNPTDSNGRTVVSDLEEGAYLFIQKDPALFEGILYQTAPFLVTVPRLVNNKYIHDVNAYPKPSIKTDETEITKKVNGKDHYDLITNYEPVTYTITTDIPELAVEFEVNDTLVDALEFVKYESIDELVFVKMGDHILEKEEVLERVKIEGQTLTVSLTKEDLEEYFNKPLKIEFRAKIKEGADLSPYIDKKIPNDCSYKLNNDYTKKSKPVTITPPPPETPPRRTPPPTSAK